MQENDEITDEYDREFLAHIYLLFTTILDIEKRRKKLNKHDRLRVESWCKKLCQVTNNIEWKKNRNLHAICLMDMILNNRFEEPYNKFAPEGSIPILSKTLVKSRLSSKFLKCSEKLYDEVPKMEKFLEKIEFDNIKNYDNNINNIINLKEEEEKNKNNQINNQKGKKEYYNNSDLNNSYNNDNINSNDNSNNTICNSEVEKLKVTIAKLQNELIKKDAIIQKEREEKTLLLKRVDELEKMLSSFLALEN